MMFIVYDSSPNEKLRTNRGQWPRLVKRKKIKSFKRSYPCGRVLVFIRLPKVKRRARVKKKVREYKGTVGERRINLPPLFV